MNLLRYILQKIGLIQKVSKVIINEKLNTIIIFEFDKENMNEYYKNNIKNKNKRKIKKK
jgi:hypothetical protein